MNLGVVGYAFAAIAFAALAVHLIAPQRQHQLGALSQRLFATAVAASAGWAALSALAAGPSAALVGRLAALLDVARYGLWFAFLLTLLNPLGGRSAKGRGLALAAAALSAVAAVLTLVADSPVDAADVPALRPLLFLGMALPVFGLFLIEQLFRNQADDHRWHAKPLCLALACGLLFDLYVYSNAVLFGQFDRDALIVRGAVHGLSAPLLFVAARRNADWLRNLQVSRDAAFHTATLVVVGLYLLFVSALGYYVGHFGGSWGGALQLGVVCAALVFLVAVVLSGAFRNRLRVFIGKNFFSYRYDYRTEWLRFTSMLSVKGTPRETGEQIVKALAQVLQSPAGELWSRHLGSAGFVSAAQWNWAHSTDREAADSPFSRFLARSGWVVDLEEARAFPRRYEDAHIPGWLLAAPRYWLLLPLLVGDELIGFVVLARPHAPTAVNWEVRDLLKTASRQAASFLAQMHATEALLESRKFDAFNRMSAFVVHDLKNIVTQLSLMLQNAKRLQDNPEFRQDMLDTVENSLEKMKQLMLQLREGEKPASLLCGVELVPIAERLRDTSAARGRELQIEVLDPVVTRGHEDRVARVLGHVVQNAFDATPASGRVWLRLQRAGGQAKVVVGDTGRGMSEDFVHNRLFRPFNTTKHNGMGIGAYESFQYIQELGGSIAVDSAPGRGTVIEMTLPIFEADGRSDLELSSTP